MKWTPEADAQLASLYATMSAVEVAAVMGCNKSSVKNRVHKLGLKKPSDHVNHGCFVAGSLPWNKGKRFDSGGRSHETRFKKGSKPQTWKPVGYERVTKDGYRERKMTDTGVTRHDFVGLHTMLWIEHHGDVPKGCAIVFRNGDKTDIRIENLECVTRAELMRRNSYHTRFPQEVRHLVQLRGAITRQINKRAKA